MQNITTELKNGKLVITIDVTAASLKAAKPSATGKTLIVASSQGNKPIEIGGGKSVTIGVNAYIKPSA